MKAIGDRLEEVIDERTQSLDWEEGERLSVEERQEIYIQVMGEIREKMNIKLNTRTKTGEIDDYLEVRRPFGAAQ